MLWVPVLHIAYIQHYIDSVNEGLWYLCGNRPKNNRRPHLIIIVPTCL